MFEHVGLGVSDDAASKAPFLQALQPRGVGIGLNVEAACRLPPP